MPHCVIIHPCPHPIHPCCINDIHTCEYILYTVEYTVYCRCERALDIADAYASMIEKDEATNDDIRAMREVYMITCIIEYNNIHCAVIDDIGS